MIATILAFLLCGGLWWWILKQAPKDDDEEGHRLNNSVGLRLRQVWWCWIINDPFICEWRNNRFYCPRCEWDAETDDPLNDSAFMSQHAHSLAAPKPGSDYHKRLTAFIENTWPEL